MEIISTVELAELRSRVEQTIAESQDVCNRSRRLVTFVDALRPSVDEVLKTSRRLLTEIAHAGSRAL